jgi:nitrogen fixation NifU-like protein
LAEAQKLMDGFLQLVKGEKISGLSPDDREHLDVMSGLSEFPMRVKCATLAWHTFSNAIEEGSNAIKEGQNAVEEGAR